MNRIEAERARTLAHETWPADHVWIEFDGPTNGTERAREQAKEGDAVSGTAYAYVGRKVCGCVVMLIVDDLDHKKETAKEIAKAVRLGETIERMSVEDARKAHPFGCKCAPTPADR